MNALGLSQDQHSGIREARREARKATIGAIAVVISAIQAIGLFLLVICHFYSPLTVTPYRMGLTPGEIFNNLDASPSTMWEAAFWLVTIWNALSLLSAKIGDSSVWNWAAIIINLVLIVGNLVVTLVSLAVHGFNANLEPGLGGHIFNPANDPNWCCKLEMYSNPASQCPWSVGCTGNPGYFVSIGARELKWYWPYILRLAVIGLHSLLQILLVILAWVVSPKPPSSDEFQDFFRSFSTMAKISSNVRRRRKKRRRRALAPSAQYTTEWRQNVKKGNVNDQGVVSRGWV